MLCIILNNCHKVDSVFSVPAFCMYMFNDLYNDIIISLCRPFSLTCVQSIFNTGRRIFLTSRSSGKSLRIVDGGVVNGLGGKGKKGKSAINRQPCIYTWSYSLQLPCLCMGGSMLILCIIEKTNFLF